MIKLKVLSEGVGDENPYTDFTHLAYDFIFNSFRLVLGAGDSLYVAHPDDKTINRFYMEFTNSDESLNEPLEVQYWDGLSWREVLGVMDETDGLTRSGFIYWDQVEMKKIEVNGITLKWIRLQTKTMKAIGKVRGVNLVFSHDRDLLEDNPDILDYLKEGETSFIGRHQAARKFIIQELRNKGNLDKGKRRAVKDIDEWDILNPVQLREASKYYVLHLIYFNISDEDDDRYARKSDQYLEKYRDAIDLAYLAIDITGGGLLHEEDLAPSPTAVVRMV